MRKNDNIKLSLFDIDIDKEIINKLNNNGIKNIKELCKINRKRLTEYNFSSIEIKQIIIKLQLLGLDLAKK